MSVWAGSTDKGRLSVLGAKIMIPSTGGRAVPELAAAVVVLNDHVLIVRRSESEGFLPGQWGVPCGKVDSGETSQQAVLRELQEETGLSGTVVRCVGRSDFRSNWRGRRVENVQRNYLVSPDIDSARVDPAGMPEVSPPKQDQAFKWVPAGKIGDVGLDSHNLRTIRQGLAAGVSRQPANSSSSASR